MTKERGEMQGEKEPNTRTKHRAIICTERAKTLVLINNNNNTQTVKLVMYKRQTC